MAFNLEDAKTYVRSINRAGVPRAVLPTAAATEATEVFDKAKAQSPRTLTMGRNGHRCR